MTRFYEQRETSDEDSGRVIFEVEEERLEGESEVRFGVELRVVWERS